MLTAVEKEVDRCLPFFTVLTTSMVVDQQLEFAYSMSQYLCFQVPLIYSRCWLNFDLCLFNFHFDLALALMAGIGNSLPPSQFNLTVTFGSEEVIPVERLFKAFGLENLMVDPNQVILPQAAEGSPNGAHHRAVLAVQNGLGVPL